MVVVGGGGADDVARERVRALDEVELRRREGEREAHARRSTIATTPWPPAAQIEIRRGPSPRSASSFAAVARIRAPVAANGWPVASEEPATLRRVAVDRAEALLLPGGERGQHLGRERLVDLVEVEVLQRQPGALEQPRDGVDGRHQQRPSSPCT